MAQQHTPAPLPPSTVDLVSQLGHDFNNLLGIILGGVSLLRDDLPQEVLGRDVHGVLEDILSATHEASVLVERLTAAAGRQISSASLINLDDVLLRFVKRHAGDLPGDMRISTQPAPAPVMAWADPLKLEHCLSELVDNAVEATQGKGRLVLAAHAEPAPGIDVVDDGPGMAPELLARCAAPYVTTWRQSGHRGLGLSVVQGLLQVSGAQLHIESAPGEGTRVSMQFSPERLEATPKQ